MELKLSPCTAKTRFRNLPSRPAVLPLRRPQRRRKRTASSSKGRMFLSRSAHWLIRLRTVSQSLRLACSWRQIRHMPFVGPKKILQQRKLGAYECSGFIARLPRGSVRRRNAFRQAKTLQLAPPLIGCGQAHSPSSSASSSMKERTLGKMQRQNMGYLL